MPTLCELRNKDSVSLKYGAIFTEQSVVEQFFKHLIYFFITIYATLGDIAVFHRSCHLLKRILPQSEMYRVG